MNVTRFDPPVFYYTFGAHPPALRIAQGERVATWTPDSSNGDQQGRPIPREKRQPGEGLLEFNPLVGPFYVDGAKPGDTLVVRFHRIEANRDTAFGAVHGHLAVLGDDMTFVGPTGLKPPIEGRSYDWRLDRGRGAAVLELPRSRIGRVEIPLRTFLGCVGVAPRWGEFIHSVDARGHGGNLDCPDIRSGVEVHLPVHVPGALLLFGDAHAAQGDGEIAGGALETSADVEFHCEVIKGRALRWPRVVDDEHIMTLASARPLLAALRIGWVEMVLWLEAEFGYDKLDAVHVLSQAGRARVCNAVSPNYTVAVKFPRRLLPC